MSFTRAIAFPSAATSVIVTFSNKGNCFLFLAKMINFLIYGAKIDIKYIVKYFCVKDFDYPHGCPAFSRLSDGNIYTAQDENSIWTMMSQVLEALLLALKNKGKKKRSEDFFRSFTSCPIRVYEKDSKVITS